MTKENKQIPVCPYFSTKMRACSLSADGIYLPPKVHVLTYCLTPKHTECSIYTRFIPMDAECRHTPADGRNRRRFRRVQEEWRVLIRTCSPEGIVIGDFAEMASTIDYSQKGMRVTLNKEIPNDSLLLFDFDMDFLIPRLQGFAQLCWDRKHSEELNDIEAGLIFKDEYSQRALSLAIAEPSIN